jgi:UPF0271 protein
MARLMELNADVGEGWDDEPIFCFVDRVSIACGGHAGDEKSMLAALLRARDMGVIPGAHPSYPDRESFGRNPVAAEAGSVRRWLAGQTHVLKRLAEQSGTRLFHVKPHGALYSVAAYDKAVAKEVIEAAQEIGGLALVCLAGSPLAGWARRAGLDVLEEAFADRRYLTDGSLAPRNQAGAVIDDPAEAAAQARRIAHGEPVAALGGGALRLKANTLCLHADKANALDFACAVASALDA